MDTPNKSDEQVARDLAYSTCRGGCPTDNTTPEWAKIIAKYRVDTDAKAQSEIARLREALIVAAVVLRDSLDDWRVVAGEESIIYMRVENANRVVRAALGYAK